MDLTKAKKRVFLFFAIILIVSLGFLLFHFVIESTPVVIYAANENNEWIPYQEMEATFSPQLYIPPVVIALVAAVVCIGIVLTSWKGNADKDKIKGVEKLQQPSKNEQ